MSEHIQSIYLNFIKPAIEKINESLDKEKYFEVV